MFIFFHIEIPIEEIWSWCGTGRLNRLNRLHRLNPPRIRRFRSALSSIKKLGKDLHSIKLLVENMVPDPPPYPRYRYLTDVIIGDIIEGCPKLKTLTLEPLERGRDLTIERNCLEKLLKSGKELETLRVIKGCFPDLFDEKEVKEILPTWNVEMKECKFIGI